MILLVVVLLLSIYFAHQSNSVIASEKQLPLIPVHSNIKIPQATHRPAETSDVLFEDDFNTVPLGFNTSLWNLSIHSNPPITWEDEDRLILRAKPISYVILKSIIETGTNVIAEFNLTFSEGLCYFAVGWGDRVIDSSNEWQANLRLSQNGVFVDYWDNELCLVCYSNGERIAAPVENISLRTVHQFKMEWRTTLVKLFVDNEESVVISRRIPLIGLPFIITTSGHYERSEEDELCMEYVRVSSLSSYNLNYPCIDLIWPLNGSQLSHYDEIDFDLYGSDGVLIYSWNNNNNETIDAPWDISTPQTIGLHTLEVFARNALDIWNSTTYYFEIVQQTMVELCPEMRTSPLIDGDVNDREQGDSLVSIVRAMNENRHYEELTVYLSFWRQTIYIGIESKLADKWNSHLSILIDGNGDGKWNNEELAFLQDISITIGTPSSYGASSKIYSPAGLEISKSEFPGLMTASSMQSDKASFELLLDLTSVNGNASRGIGIGIIISRGGYESFFPTHLGYGTFSDLLVVKSTGITRIDPTISSLVMSGNILLVLLGLFGILYVISSRRRVTLESHLNDEELERIKTLLYSYDKISLDRLARLSGIEKKRVEKLVGILVSRGLADISIIEFEQGFIRELEESNNRGNNSKNGGELV